jgi:hypothetical protein
MLDGLGETPQADDRHRLQRRRLGSVRRRQQHLPAPKSISQVGDGEAAPHRANGAVEAELAGDQPTLQSLLGDLLVGREHRQRDGEVEVVALLAEVGRREIDDDGLGFEVEAAVLDRGAHPLAALAHRGVGQTDDLDLRESIVDVDLHLDETSFDSPWGCGCGAG